MPPNGYRDPTYLLQSFLNLVFTNVVESGLVRSARCVGPVSLGYGDDGDLLSVSAARRGGGNSRPHFGYTISQAGKSHSCQI